MPGKLSTTDFMRRYKRADTLRQQYVNTVRNASDYICPNRNNWYDQKPDGAYRSADTEVYDSTGQSALDSFVSNVQSALYPPMKKWTNLVAGTSIDENRRSEFQIQLDNISEILFSKLRISNFDTQIAESIYDLAFGTGAIFVHKGDKKVPFRFESVPISQLSLVEGPQGRVDGFFRRRRVMVRNVEREWAAYKLEIPKELSDAMADESQAEKDWYFIDAVMPEEYEAVDVKTGKKKKEQGFCYYVYCEKSKTFLVQNNQKSSPCIGFRWSVRPGEVYGWGVALNAAADVRTLNKAKQLLLDAGSISLTPIFTYVDDGVVNVRNIMISPGEFIPVRANSGSPMGRSIESLTTSPRFDLSQFIMKDLQASIQTMFLTNPIGSLDMPIRSATEISVRQAIFARQSGSAYGRQRYECADPLIDRMLYILDELGLIDLQGLTRDGDFIDIEYRSPLTMAQSQEELSNLIQFSEIITNMYGREIAALLLNNDKFMLELGKLTNIPQHIVPTKEQFAQLRETLTQSMATGRIAPNGGGTADAA